MSAKPQQVNDPLQFQLRKFARQEKVAGLFADKEPRFTPELRACLLAAADSIEGYEKSFIEGTKLSEEVERLNARIAELQGDGVAKDARIVELHGEVGSLRDKLDAEIKSRPAHRRDGADALAVRIAINKRLKSQKTAKPSRRKPKSPAKKPAKRRR